MFRNLDPFNQRIEKKGQKNNTNCLLQLQRRDEILGIAEIFDREWHERSIDIEYLVNVFFNGYLIDILVYEKAKYNLEKW